MVRKQQPCLSLSFGCYFSVLGFFFFLREKTSKWYSIKEQEGWLSIQKTNPNILKHCGCSRKWSVSFCGWRGEERRLHICNDLDSCSDMKDRRGVLRPLYAFSSKRWQAERKTEKITGAGSTTVNKWPWNRHLMLITGRSVVSSPFNRDSLLLEMI